MDTESHMASGGRACRGALKWLLIANACAWGTCASAESLFVAQPDPALQSERLTRKEAATKSSTTSNRRRSEVGAAKIESTSAKRTVAPGRKTAVAKLAPSLRRPVTGLLNSVPEYPERARFEACRQQLDRELQPARLVKLAEACEKELPKGKLADELNRLAGDARNVLEVQRRAGMSGDVFEEQLGDGFFRESIGKAVRGDKEAAYHIAQSFRQGRVGVPPNQRRMEQWLRFSAELGHGRASWELAEHYNYVGLVADAARFEKRAHELGFRPAARLPSRGY